MNRLEFLTKYAEDGVHYDAVSEIDRVIASRLGFLERFWLLNHPAITDDQKSKIDQMIGIERGKMNIQNLTQFVTH